MTSPEGGQAGIPGGSQSGGGAGGQSGADGESGAGGDAPGGGGRDGQDSGGGGDSDVFGSGGERTAGTGGGGEDEFDRALEDFDNVISEEQEAIARGSGEAADEAVASAGGSGVMGSGEPSQSGERAIIGGPAGAPRDRTSAQVEGCNDDDTVARQLCEAATMEQDPFLRAALWDEYNQYKRILGRL